MKFESQNKEGRARRTWNVMSAVTVTFVETVIIAFEIPHFMA
jgi:hypothetical protein